MALPLVPIALNLGSQVAGGVATTLLINAIMDDDEVIDALQKLQAMLVKIDKSILDGFTGKRDVVLGRLTDQQHELQSESLNLFQEMRDLIAEHGISNPDILSQLHRPGTLNALPDAQPLLDQSRRMEEVLDRLSEVNTAIQDRRAELVQGVSPAFGVGPVGADAGTAANACCCVHEQVMGA